MNACTQTHRYPHVLGMCTHRLSSITSREKKLGLCVFESGFYHSVLKSVGFVKMTASPTPLSALFLLKWWESPGINNSEPVWSFYMDFASSKSSEGWAGSCGTFGNLGSMYFLKLGFPSWIHRNYKVKLGQWQFGQRIVVWITILLVWEKNEN